MADYVPQKGDFISLNFSPQSGHEQKGRRPAIVINNDLYSQKTGLVIVCPITNTNKGYRFHVKTPDYCILSGYIMVEQVQSLDYLSRNVKFIEKAPPRLVSEVLAILGICIY